MPLYLSLLDYSMSGYYYDSESLSPANQGLLCHFIFSSEPPNHKAAQVQRPGTGTQVCLWHQVPPTTVCYCCRTVKVVGDLFPLGGGRLLWVGTFSGP